MGWWFLSIVSIISDNIFSVKPMINWKQRISWSGTYLSALCTVRIKSVETGRGYTVLRRITLEVSRMKQSLGSKTPRTPVKNDIRCFKSFWTRNNRHNVFCMSSVSQKILYLCVCWRIESLTPYPGRTNDPTTRCRVEQKSATMTLNKDTNVVEQDKNPVLGFQEMHLSRPPHPQQLVPDPDAAAASLLKFQFALACCLVHQAGKSLAHSE